MNMIESSETIENLINRLFSNKDESKRSNWIKIISDEEYENSIELKDAKLDFWNKLPSLVSDKIKKDLGIIELQIKNASESELNKDNNNLQESNIKDDKNIIDNSKNNSLKEKSITITEKENNILKLSKEEEESITLYLNDDLDKKQIIKFMRAQNTPKEELILKFIDLKLQRPQRPIPKNCKKLIKKLEGEKLPLFQYTGKKLEHKQYYTLLVMGETGSGKSTLLDSFVNYLDNVDISDQWRWKLVDENHFENKHSSKSQTSEITTYYINDARKNRFNIRIIDTPGFGDTEGVNKDEEITKKFEHLFKNDLQEVDYILIVMKASETRWTSSNEYIYDKVCELFGKDIKDRFILMCTFSDGRQPLCVETAKPHLPFNSYFKFNNSTLYTPYKDKDSSVKMYWKLGMDSLDEFFEFIGNRNLLPVSLSQSKEVLQIRSWLYAAIEAAESNISKAFIDLEELKNVFKQIKLQQKKIDDNQDYEIEINKVEYKSHPLSNTYQMCQICQVVCCQSCVWPKNSPESLCTYFNGGKNCPMCPKRCPKENHIRAVERIEKITLKEKEIVKYKSDAFKEGKYELSISEVILNSKKKQMLDLGKDILNEMNEVKDFINRLEMIALKPRLFTSEDYFKKMISNEEEKKREGYIERVKGIKRLQAKAKHLKLIENSKSIMDVFPNYEEEINKLGSGEVKNEFCSVF